MRSSLGRIPDPAATFRALFGTDRHAVWIDREFSSGSGGTQSIMGSAEGPGSETLTYEVGQRSVRSSSPGAADEYLEGTIFDALRRRLAELRLPADPRLDFGGGYLGYLGYELKADLGSPGRRAGDLPDACLIRPGALVVLDHTAGEAHAIRLLTAGEDVAEAEAEVRRMRDRLSRVEAEPTKSINHGPRPSRTALDRDRYLAAITEIQRRLRGGEAYEVCLTNQFEVDVAEGPDPLDLYLHLRGRSRAPQAGYMRMGDLALLSASPENFLRIDGTGRVTTSPTKGTRPRGDDPISDRAIRDELASSEKERAENVMIVDVVRNDLGRVCEFGSIEVERLAEVESFTHVHQLVSTISGLLASGKDVVDCVEACFPGGSMTGAPKLRAMEIADGLEPCARGPYSGAFGRIGLDGGLDLSIVIRSIVTSAGVARVGAGGAVTVLSDPEAEYEEMLVKARALLEVLGSGSAAEPDRLQVGP